MRFLPTETFRSALVVAAGLLVPTVCLAQTCEIDEPVTDSRVFAVRQSMKLTGKLNAPLPGGKLLPLDMKGSVAQSFRERRLTGFGRDAKAYRMLRSYQKAALVVTVAREKTVKSLTETSRLIVAHGTPSGLSVFSPNGPLTYDDLELLKMPGDSLSLLPLLPPGKVTVGQSWTPPGFSLQMLTGIDAIAKTSVACKLKRVTEGKAIITVAGKVEGARDGAPTTIEIKGELSFHLARKYVAALKLKQTEKSRTGPISPALDVTAEIELTRTPTGDSAALSKKSTAGLSLDPTPRSQAIRFEPVQDAQFFLNRGWHVTYRRKKIAMLRYLKEGNLLAQVTIRPLPPAAPGKHVSEMRFQKDIATSLGNRLKSFTKAEQIKTKAVNDRRFLYRVIAEGKDNGIEMRWHYYLCAAPDGRQVSLVFAIEKKLLKPFDDQDLGFVLGVRFPKK